MQNSRFSSLPNNTQLLTVTAYIRLSKFRRVSTTCQCRLGLLLASAFRLPAGLLCQVYQRVQFYLENVGPYRCNRNSAISERKSSSPTRSGCTQRHLAIIFNTELPDCDSSRRTLCTSHSSQNGETDEV